MKLHLQSFSQFFKKIFLKPKLSRRLILLIAVCLMGLILLSGASVAAAVFYQQQRSQTASYQLVLNSPQLADTFYTLGVTGEIDVLLKGQRAMTWFEKDPELLIQAVLDDQVVLDTTFVPSQDSTDVSVGKITLDSEKLGQGEHVLKAVLSNKETAQKLTEKTISIINDQVWPQLLSIKSDKGNLSRYDISQPATGSATASTSAKTGLKIISNSKGPFTITFSFSELVKLGSNKNWGDNLADSQGSLVFTQPTTATLSATFTATASQLKLPLSFQDPVGHQLVAELQYVYDGQAPQLGELHNVTLWEQSKDSFFFTFTSSEPLATARGTVNGVTKTATGGPKYYRISGLPLNVGENKIQIVAQDAAGNTTTNEITATMNAGAPKSYPFNFNSSQNLPAHVRHCTDEDKKICGYENVSEMTCEQFMVVKNCLKSRCSRDGFYLGDCEG
jgi:hypothetical protein